MAGRDDDDTTRHPLIDIARAMRSPEWQRIKKEYDTGVEAAKQALGPGNWSDLNEINREIRQERAAQDPAAAPSPSPEPPPPENAATAANPAPADTDAPHAAPSVGDDEPTTGRSREQEACKQFTIRKFPDGYDSIKTSVIMHAAELDKEFKQAVVPFPKRDVWLRALGRRKD
jgi:hypothetical protein